MATAITLQSSSGLFKTVGSFLVSGSDGGNRIDLISGLLATYGFVYLILPVSVKVSKYVPPTFLKVNLVYFCIYLFTAATSWRIVMNNKKRPPGLALSATEVMYLVKNVAFLGVGLYLLDKFNQPVEDEGDKASDSKDPKTAKTEVDEASGSKDPKTAKKESEKEETKVEDSEDKEASNATPSDPTGGQPGPETAST
eukprot:GHVQ01022500.1.p1 GENE.GHVQ01022500.1~~GHVQ01022500.1.p1  ORF type:complete len:197 (+),score=21.29 GHVQ01022500.1:289-879(+)